MGRFFSLDPFIRLSSGFSRYSFAGDSPIILIDYDGKFKFPAGANYQNKYPRLTNYVKNEIQAIANNPKIMNALAKWSELPKSEIKKALECGNGPTIVVEPMKDDDTKGYYTYKEPDKLFINKSLVDNLEKSEGRDRDAYQFLTAVTILHEFTYYGDEQVITHWGTNQSSYENVPYEEGDEFEKQAYGEKIWFEQAKRIVTGYIERQQQQNKSKSKKTPGIEIGEIKIEGDVNENSEDDLNKGKSLYKGNPGLQTND